jgi:hypothetical protein
VVLCENIGKMKIIYNDIMSSSSMLHTCGCAVASYKRRIHKERYFAIQSKECEKTPTHKETQKNGMKNIIVKMSSKQWHEGLNITHPDFSSLSQSIVKPSKNQEIFPDMNSSRAY